MWVVPNARSRAVLRARPPACEPARVLVLLGGDAGLRIGEIIALDWARVDFAADKVHVEVPYQVISVGGVNHDN
jgi:integrase